MIRCTKKGYFETPSPLIECTKDVDALSFTDLYCGYHHHRYIIWSDYETNEIYILPKYSCILDTVLKISDETKNYLNNPFYWNHYVLWDANKPPKIIVYKNGINLGIKKHFLFDYVEKCTIAINQSIKNTDYFVSKIIIKNESTVDAIN